MQIRSATSCLYAMAKFLNSLPTEHIENIENELKLTLLTNSTFWKLNKHPTPSVRLINLDFITFSQFQINFFNFSSLGETGLVYFIAFNII